MSAPAELHRPGILRQLADNQPKGSNFAGNVVEDAKREGRDMKANPVCVSTRTGLHRRERKGRSASGLLYVKACGKSR